MLQWMQWSSYLELLLRATQDPTQITYTWCSSYNANPVSCIRGESVKNCWYCHEDCKIFYRIEYWIFCSRVYLGDCSPWLRFYLRNQTFTVNVRSPSWSLNFYFIETAQQLQTKLQESFGKLFIVKTTIYISSVLVSMINPSSCSSQSVSGSTWAQKEFQQQSKPHAHTSRQRRCGFLGVLNKIFYRLLHLDIFSNLPETQVVWEKDLTPWIAMVLVRFRGIFSVCMVLKYHIIKS